MVGLQVDLVERGEVQCWTTKIGLFKGGSNGKHVGKKNIRNA
jgi:hypothetical protein